MQSSCFDAVNIFCRVSSFKRRWEYFFKILPKIINFDKIDHGNQLGANFYAYVFFRIGINVNLQYLLVHQALRYLRICQCMLNIMINCEKLENEINGQYILGIKFTQRRDVERGVVRCLTNINSFIFFANPTKINAVFSNSSGKIFFRLGVAIEYNILDFPMTNLDFYRFILNLKNR